MSDFENKGLEKSLEEIKSQPIDELFKQAVIYVKTAGVDYKIKALELFKEVVYRDPEYRSGDDDNAYYYMGNIAFYTMEELNLAQEYYTEALRVDPKDILSLQNRGFCWMAQERYNEALLDLNQAVEMDMKKDYLNPEIEEIIREAEKKLAEITS